jgi:hypothetical protein
MTGLAATTGSRRLVLAAALIALSLLPSFQEADCVLHEPEPIQRPEQQSEPENVRSFLNVRSDRWIVSYWLTSGFRHETYRWTIDQTGRRALKMFGEQVFNKPGQHKFCVQPFRIVAFLLGTTLTYPPATSPFNQLTTSVNAQCWGGGGPGVAGLSTRGGNGGKGGGFAGKANTTVSSGTNVTVNVGAAGVPGVSNGGDTWFVSTSTVIAQGGGSATTQIGDVGSLFTGGAGGSSAVNTNGSGGGGGAGTTANGTAGSTNLAGGIGGNGYTVAGPVAATPGAAPGGGGGGASTSTVGSPAAGGGLGQVITTFTITVTVIPRMTLLGVGP